MNWGQRRRSDTAYGESDAGVVERVSDQRAARAVDMSVLMSAKLGL